MAGAPSATFGESPSSLADAAAAQDLYFAAVRAAEAGDGAEWSALAPTVPVGVAAPLDGASIAGFPRSLATELDVASNQLTKAVLSIEVTLEGADPGNFDLTVTEARHRRQARGRHLGDGVGIAICSDGVASLPPSRRSRGSEARTGRLAPWRAPVTKGELSSEVGRGLPVNPSVGAPPHGFPVRLAST